MNSRPHARPNLKAIQPDLQVQNGGCRLFSSLKTCANLAQSLAFSQFFCATLAQSFHAANRRSGISATNHPNRKGFMMRFGMMHNCIMRKSQRGERAPRPGNGFEIRPLGAIVAGAWPSISSPSSGPASART
ncbi:MAG: hypothetical protein ACOYMV_03130, partial [Verrucomicrobiia bacterium]